MKKREVVAVKEIETIEKNLEAIETYIPGLPGTSLTRVLLDVNWCRKYSIKVPKKMVLKQREAVMVWCVGVGTLNMPKNFYYGFTPSGAVRAALSALKTLKNLANCASEYEDFPPFHVR